ncbi:arylesterase [Larsenimonas suaedae]|uniref:Arylesterase n=1 Tax=Larsenimonas suaedae TaxID=1851019 RepID=A0ABU1GWK5_9GAMM|nr:arylesterase [Larsenimonas suaedae]MCM2972989.1 arylesterase [Larsenimonas suaedae]MDR5896426.1 arylesterase [Larsenimonas suaedae]
MLKTLLTSTGSSRPEWTRPRWAAALILALGLAATGAARAETILVFGDSLSAAHNMPTDKGWVHLLQQRLGDKDKVINASISGETTSGGLERLPKALEQFDPDIVLLELGGNDGLRGLPPAQIQSRLDKMIQLIQDHPARVGLLGIMVPPNYGQNYSTAFKNIYPTLAEKYGLPLEPFMLDGVALDDDLMQDDAIHPNARAQPKVLDNVWSVVDELLSLPPASKSS